jgi:hypothetical protein
MSTLTVVRRFRGPTGSANGGYICGLLAARAPEPVVVRLLEPPPLDTPLEVVDLGGTLEVRSAGVALARARPGDIGDLTPPPAPSRGLDAEASARYAGFATHPAPECFVCGPQRADGEGLRIFCGFVGLEVVAGPWTPDASLDAGDGAVGAEFVWAALDCPGYAAVAPDMRPMLLGELAARIDRRVAVGEPCTVVGWKIAASGRKHEAGTALYGAHGDLCGVGRAVWIEPRPGDQS